MPSSQPSPQGNDSGANGEMRTAFFTNHAHVLACLTRSPEVTLRQVALELQMTERAVQRIVSDLEKEGILAREKVGRCNQYLIAKSTLLGHPLENHHTIAEFLEFADS